MHERVRVAPPLHKQEDGSMKLAIYMHDLSGGGVERMKFDLIAAFQRAGHNVTLLLHRLQGELVNELTLDINVVSFDKTRVSADLGPLVQYIRQEQPDVLISSLNHQNVVALTAKALAFSRTKVIICQHNALSTEASMMTGWKYRVIPALYRLLSPFAAGIVAVSDGVASDICAASGINRTKISVIYNPTIGPDFAAKLAEPAPHPWFHDGGPPVYITAGRLVLQKDHATLLRAFALHRATAKSRLMILGNGPLEKELKALAADFGIADVVTFVGFVANPLPSMRESVAFLLTSRYEGFGNVMVEAMGCGTPVVAFDCSFGPAEILDHGRYGRLISPGDVKAFGKAISPKLREDFPADMLKARAHDFTAEASANGYLDLIDSIDSRHMATA
jgi:glycosyltransferase involved in cell wall biosynthesis